ncbi:hypothetical protein BH10PAT4_BH10PAT4_0030 [soil metagenome]
MNVKIIGLLAACVAAALSLAGCATQTPQYSETCTTTANGYDKLQAYSTCEVDHQHDALAKELTLTQLLVPLDELDSSVTGIVEFEAGCLVVVIDTKDGRYNGIIQSRYDPTVNVSFGGVTASQFASWLDDYRVDCDQLPTT